MDNRNLKLTQKLKIEYIEEEIIPEYFIVKNSAKF